MQIRTLIITASIVIGGLSFSGCHISTTKTGPPAVQDTAIHAMLHPDSNTVYLDTAGNKIAISQFMESLKSGRFIFVPNMKGGKVVSIRLKTAQQKVAMGSMAPEFFGTALDGQAIDLKALKGKTVILNFWFTSCAPCIAEMPELNDLVEKYKNDSSIVFLWL